MTARRYPDRDATSPNGRYQLEARAPHNGTIPYRDGRFAGATERAHQHPDLHEFRYQLLDTATGNEVVWERWQHREDSPAELVVGDEAWSIICVCDFNPEVIAVTPTGRDALRIVVASDARTEQEALLGIVARGANARRWCPNTLYFTKTGSFWTGNSWRYFLSAFGTRYFVWRSARGARLIIDLDAEELVTEEDARDTGLETYFVERESADALQMLSQFVQRLDAIRTALASDKLDKWYQEPLQGIWNCSSALVLAAAHRIRAAVPLLRALETLHWPGPMTGTYAFSSPLWLHSSGSVRLVQHVLRILDEEPLGVAAYSFKEGLSDPNATRVPAPECVPNRRERTRHLTREASAFDVLQLLGAPDHVTRSSRKVGTVYEWTEHWEYDFRTATGWVTLRISWGDSADRGRIVEFAEGPAAWLESDEPRANCSDIDRPFPPVPASGAFPLCAASQTGIGSSSRAAGADTRRHGSEPA